MPENIEDIWLKHRLEVEQLWLKPQVSTAITPPPICRRPLLPRLFTD
jgi:hypothetical protein